MYSHLIEPPEAPAIAVVAWDDLVIDALGHDPRSTYAEWFWLPVIGPSTLWLARRIAAGLDEHPDGFELPLAATARALGLGDRGGRNSPLWRSVNRLIGFELARPFPSGQGLAVRRRFPPLCARQLARLTPELARAHRAWGEAHAS